MKQVNKEKKPWIPRGLYNILSSSNRTNLWTVGIGCFVTIFTFWLGLSYQYTIVNNTRKEAHKNTHYNMLKFATENKVAYNKCIEDVLSNSISMTIKELVEDTTYLYKYREQILNKDWQKTIQKIKDGINISERAKYYFPEEQFRKITFNNLKIAEIVDEYYSAIDTNRVNNFINYNFLIQNNGNSDLYRELLDSLEDFRKKPYFSNKEINERVEKNIGVNIYKFWAFMESSYVQSLSFSKVYEETMKVVLDKSSKTDTIDVNTLNKMYSDKDVINEQNKVLSEITLENLLYARKWVLEELTMFMSNNYHIINDEVTPLNYSYTTTKNTDDLMIEPGYILALLSLLFIVPIGFIIWYSVIWLIFRNAEIPNTKSIEEWDKQEELLKELAVLSIISRLLKK